MITKILDFLAWVLEKLHLIDWRSLEDLDGAEEWR